MAARNSTSNSTRFVVRYQTGPVCLKFPQKINNPGLPALLTGKDRHESFMDYSAPRLQVQMIAIYVVTQAFHSLLKHFGTPLFISHVLAGIILGPMVFNAKYSLVNDSEDSVAILGTMGGLGFLFFMFLSGVKMNVGLTFKSGKKAVYIGILTVVVPLMACLMTIKFLHPEADFFFSKKLFLLVSYSGTSFPVIHSLLTELKMLNSELGRLGLSAALIGDMVTLVLTMSSKWLKIWVEIGTKQVLKNIAGAIVFIVIVVFVLRLGIKWMVKHIPQDGQKKDLCFYLVVLASMMSPRFTQLFHINPSYGPFILGLFIPNEPPLGSSLVEKLDPFVSGLFLPVFAATCGMRINPSSLRRYNEYGRDQSIAAVVTVIVKFGVSLALSRSCMMPMRDCLALAFIMISKGIVEISYYSVIYDSMVISSVIYANMIVMIMLISSIVPIIVKWLYDPSSKYLCFQKRTIMNSKMNQELQMIGCIHVPGHVNSVMNLLNAFCPTRGSPIALSVLHLVKLRGRATPLFIAHHKQIVTASEAEYSENIVIAFKQFERERVVSVNIFTAVSPPNSMYEDICNLAIDQLTSFIILPFHRSWYIDGSIELEDQTIRNLNSDILKRAPCSVGILIEGRHGPKTSNLRESMSSWSQNSSTNTIAVIFMGGQDDREALALAKRIAQDESASVTIIHLKATDNTGTNVEEKDRALDDEMLNYVKESEHLTYHEEQVNDGTETAIFLRSIVEDYQLIIVGRRYKKEDPQTLGLEEWCEFEEIGIIGDMLSSADFISNYSLLIVQQQRQRTS